MWYKIDLTGYFNYPKVVHSINVLDAISALTIYADMVAATHSAIVDTKPWTSEPV